MGSPTFVATFRDGEVTRMTTFTSRTELDVRRGVRIARHAYQQRKRQAPPAIVKACFEDSDSREILAAYNADDLAA
jgi:hypothetical protein